jgi:F420-dependent oxidoreductase-like protein
MKVGVALPHYDFSFPGRRPATVDAVVAFAKRVEDLGYDSVWISDHFFLDLSRYGGPPGRWGSLEALTTLSSIAVETERVRLGTLVLCEAFRHPPVLAKMATTLDILSHGRLELGMGAGWNEEEYVANGFLFAPVGERIARLRECVDILGGMMSSERFSYAGEFYTVEDAPNDPRPVQRPRPPIWIGGKGKSKILRMVAEAADGWNTVWRWSPDAYKKRLGDLERACEQAGRDPSTVLKSVGLYTILGTDEGDARHQWDRMAVAGPIDATGMRREEFVGDALVGGAEHCIGRIKEFEALGVDHLVVAFGVVPFSVWDDDQVELFAREVLPAVR